MEDSSGAGAVPQPRTQDGGNGRDRTGLEGAVGGGAPQYDGGVRAAERPEQRQEQLPKSGEERAREISGIDATLAKLGNPPKPLTPERVKEELAEVEVGYRTVGIDVENLRIPDFLREVYITLHNLYKNPEKIMKGGRKSLEMQKNQLDMITKMIKEGLYGKDYKPTNKSPGGLYGEYNMAVEQRLMADNAMGEIERILSEINVETAKCQQKIANTSATDVHVVQTLVNEQTARDYHKSQLEERMVEFEGKFTEYDDNVTVYSQRIKESGALYQQALGLKQKIIRVLGPYSRDNSSDKPMVLMAGMVSDITKLLTQAEKIINQTNELDHRKKAVLAEAAMAPVNDPVITAPTGISSYEITQRAREEGYDKVTKRRAEIRKNPFTGSYLAPPVKQ